MVNRRGPSSFRLRSSAAAKIFPKFFPFSLSFFLLLLLAFFIFVFIFSSSEIHKEDEKAFSVAEESEAQQVPDYQLWGSPSSYNFHPCVKPTSRYKDAQEWDRYITVRSNGGLNQMRTGIADMVAVARIMNATLVIPQLDKRSFWQDSSKFSDIFDVHHFIITLRGDVRIVKELPKELESVPRARKHFTSWSGMSYYEEMARLWDEYQVIHVVKSDSRLANNDLPLDVQRLRCRALYYALRFSPPIENLAKPLRGLFYGIFW